jgi:hypothetical protein
MAGVSVNFPEPTSQHEAVHAWTPCVVSLVGFMKQAALAALTFVAIYGQEFEVASIGHLRNRAARVSAYRDTFIRGGRDMNENSMS